MHLLSDLNAFYMAHSWIEGAEVFEWLAEARAPQNDGAYLRARSLQASRLAALNQLDAADAVAVEAAARLRMGGDPWDLGHCLLALGTNAENREDYADSVRLLLEARASAMNSGDPHLICWVDVWLGWSEIFVGDLESARQHFDEAREAARSTGNETLRAYSTSKLGILADEHRDYAAGLRHHLETQASFERAGDRAGVGYAMYRASVSAHGLGDYEAALGYARASVDAFAEISHGWGVTIALCRWGFAAAGIGDLAQATQVFTDALTRAREAHLGGLAVLAVSGHGIVLSRAGQPERAAAILNATLAVDGLPSSYRLPAEVELAALALRLTPEAMATARAQAAATGVEQIADALLADPQATGLH